MKPKGGGGIAEAIPVKYVALAVLVLQNSMLALTMRYSRIMEGPRYYASTAVVIAEILKFFVSLVLLFQEEQGNWPVIVQKVWGGGESLKLAIPAGLYTVQNNLAYFAMSNLDAATYQLLYQLKILTTAIISVIMLNKSLSQMQWIALCLLSVGVGLVQTSSLTVSGAAEDTKESSLLGFVSVICACCSSGLAGVYFEKVLKGAKTSLWIRNVQLSLIGVILGFIPVLKDWDTISTNGFFYGYNTVVVVVVLLQALGGLIVALVVKYADNILKGFATSISIIISCVCSYFLFDFAVNGKFMFGAALVLYAVFLYSSPGAASPKKTNGDLSSNSGDSSSCLKDGESQIK